MTKYTTLEKKEGKNKTVFKKIVDKHSVEPVVLDTPEDFENVMFLYRDIIYGDVFVAWDADENNRRLFFGEKGDEFD